MAKKPKHTPAPPLQHYWVGKKVAQHLWGISKRNPWSSAASLVTILVGLSALGLFTFFYEHAEPLEWTSHAYARELIRQAVDPLNTVGSENQKILKSIQLDQAAGKKESIDNNIKQWNYELSKATDNHLKDLAQKQIDNLNKTDTALGNQIRTLCGEIGQTNGPCQ